MIPKKAQPRNINEYHPITLIGYIYKLLLKILANRLSKVLHYIISNCQHAFVNGRQIINAICIVNEIVGEIIQQNKEGILYKLDMEKTFDHFNWQFLDYMLQRMGFRVKWRNWIKTCVTTTSFNYWKKLNQFSKSRGWQRGKTPKI